MGDLHWRASGRALCDVNAAIAYDEALHSPRVALISYNQGLVRRLGEHRRAAWQPLPDAARHGLHGRAPRGHDAPLSRGHPLGGASPLHGDASRRARDVLPPSYGVRMYVPSWLLSNLKYKIDRRNGNQIEYRPETFQSNEMGLFFFVSLLVTPTQRSVHILIFKTANCYRRCRTPQL